ncbi:MAG: alpha/beta fold hydrolase, partial [Cycloclasticus sp.]
MDIKHVALSIGDYPLRAKLIGDTSLDKPVIVLLHGGLDCIEMWKSFPEELARASGLAVVAYERFGHGQSGKLTKPRERDYRHYEAEKVLPEVIKGLGLKK